MENDKIGGLEDGPVSPAAAATSSSAGAGLDQAVSADAKRDAKDGQEFKNSDGSKGSEADAVAAGRARQGSTKIATGPAIPLRRTLRSPNILGLPELEYLDASDNVLESLEGIRLYSRNSLTSLELRNCGIQSHHLNHLRALPLITLCLDDNQIDNLKHAVTVLKSIRSLEHLSLLGNPVARNVDRGAEACVNGAPKNNFGSVLRIDNAAHLLSKAVQARKALYAPAAPEEAVALPRPTEDGTAAPAPATATAPSSPRLGKLLKGVNLQMAALNIGDVVDAARKAEGKESPRADNEREKANYYSITVLDHIDTLKTFDHLAVPPAMYSHLRALKAQVEGDVILADIEQHFSAEIASIEHVHADLRARHSQNEAMVKQVVSTKARRLEDEMDNLLRFARDKIKEFAPGAARKMFETRAERAAERAAAAAATAAGGEDAHGAGAGADAAAAVASEEHWKQQEEKLRKLPQNNLHAIREQYADHKTRIAEEKAEVERQHSLREQEQAKKNQENFYRSIL
jgi:hypothetical protein